MLMPVNMRTGDQGRRAGNQFAPARFAVPVGLSDPAQRIRAIGALVREQRDEPALPLIDPISTALASLPNVAVMGLFAAMQKTTDFTTSNVPGPPFATYVAGARIERFMPFGPLAGAAINVTVFSYDGKMDIGMISGYDAIPDIDDLPEYLQEAFEALKAAARRHAERVSRSRRKKKIATKANGGSRAAKRRTASARTSGKKKATTKRATQRKKATSAKGSTKTGKAAPKTKRAKGRRPSRGRRPTPPTS